MLKEQISDDKLILFHEVVKLLKEYKVNYWLDQGSLLGAVRNNAFLSWDHDVDLGVWYSEIDTVKKVGKKLTDMGAHVNFFQYL
jgi:lipopolysaccharide cholinephosphotransferase